MPNNVFANNLEVSCKKADGKSICGFPDVCFTPPENPATPPGVPLPYPNTGLATDTTDGSRTVKISNQEVMLKNKSYFKRSYGDEAGCAAKKGFVSSNNMGKVYFAAWSMDVIIEGENVVRAFDLTTHNHASPLSNAVLQKYMDRIGLSRTVQDNCREVYLKYKLHPHWKSGSCGTNEESHHPVLDACFQHDRGKPTQRPYGRTRKYRSGSVPAICLKVKKHQKISKKQNSWANGLTSNPTYSDLRRQEKKNLRDGGMSEKEAECIMLAVDTVMRNRFNVSSDTPLKMAGKH